MKIRGVITAAGDSIRLGRPKALLSIAGESVLLRLQRALRMGGCDEGFIVEGGRHSDLIVEEAQRRELKHLKNEDPSAGPVSSIIRAIEEPGEWDSLLIHPVDVIGIGSKDVEALIEQSEVNNLADVWVPSYQFKRGHPVLIRREVVSRLVREDGPPHLRALIASEGVNIDHVETDNPLVLEDVDDEQDWKRISSKLGQ